LAANLSRQLYIHTASAYEFFPRTFILPKDNPAFEEFLAKRPYGKLAEDQDDSVQAEDGALHKVPLYLISKPVCAARGIGVHLLEDPSQSA
jgi:hypothetical protein